MASFPALALPAQCSHTPALITCMGLSAALVSICRCVTTSKIKQNKQEQNFLVDRNLLSTNRHETTQLSKNTCVFLSTL